MEWEGLCDKWKRRRGIGAEKKDGGFQLWRDGGGKKPEKKETMNGEEW